MYRRILAIGDIHGEYGKLVDLLAKLGYNPDGDLRVPDEDLLVFLGDYVDRGPEPHKVLGWMMRNRNNPRIVMLRGNHEQMMLAHYGRMERKRLLSEGTLLQSCLDDLADALPESEQGDIWLDNGGDVTDRVLKLYEERIAEKRGIQAARQKMAEIRRFVAELPLSHTVAAGGRTYFFCHAGVLPGIPLDRQPKATLLFAREEFYDGYKGEAVVVAGHTPVWRVRRVLRKALAGFPVIRPNMILLDTGACFGGPLSCVDVLSGRVWQSDATTTRSLATCGNRLVVNIWNLFKSIQ